MTEEIPGRIVTRLIGLFELIMVCVYTGMWIYTDCYDPKYKDRRRWEKIRGMPLEMIVIYTLNALVVVTSFVVAAFLVVASCDCMIVRWRLLACTVWFILKVCFLGYGIAGLSGAIGDYEGSPIVIGSMLGMLFEMAIVFYYIRNLTIVIKSDEAEWLESLTDKRSSNMNRVGNLANMQLRPGWNEKPISVVE